MSIDYWFWILAILSSIFVGASKGGLPLIGMLAVPIMSLVISPVVAAGLLLPIYIVSDMYGLWIYRREYDTRNIAILVPAAAIGIGIGWATAHVTSEDVVKFLVGVIGLAYCLDAVLKARRNIPAKSSDIPRGMFWGTIAGFTSFVSHAGAPPYQMYVLPQRLDKMVYAGTTTIVFAIVNLMKLPPYWFLGQVNVASLEKCLVLGPVSLVGAYLGYEFTKILPTKLFFRAVEIALFLVSVLLIQESAPGVWSLFYHLFV
ncbi:MAG: sulfite exporter TauE/SafE family protein [Aestuariivirga sp.]